MTDAVAGGNQRKFNAPRFLGIDGATCPRGVKAFLDHWGIYIELDLIDRQIQDGVLEVSPCRFPFPIPLKVHSRVCGASASTTIEPQEGSSQGLYPGHEKMQFRVPKHSRHDEHDDDCRPDDD